MGSGREVQGMERMLDNTMDSIVSACEAVGKGYGML